MASMVTFSSRFVVSVMPPGELSACLVRLGGEPPSGSPGLSQVRLSRSAWWRPACWCGGESYTGVGERSGSEAAPDAIASPRRFTILVSLPLSRTSAMVSPSQQRTTEPGPPR